MCFQLLTEQDQKHFLDLLGADCLVKIIRYEIKLTHLLESLHKNNHQHLLELLGSVHLRKLIHMDFHLRNVLAELNPSNYGQLLRLLDSDALKKIDFYGDKREITKELLFSEKDKDFFERNTVTTCPPDRSRFANPVIGRR